MTHFRIQKIVIEGNIGAGKSTTLNRLLEAGERSALGAILGDEIVRQIPADAKFVFVPECVERLRTCAGVDLLQQLYTDLKRTAFKFEIHALQTRLFDFNDAVANFVRHTSNRNLVVVVERSIHSDEAIFVRKFATEGTLSPDEVKLYSLALEAHEALAERDLISLLSADSIDVSLLATIYLRIDPEVAFARIQERARRSEIGDGSSLTLEYIRDLSARYEAVFSQPTFHGAPVIVVAPTKLDSALPRSVMHTTNFVTTQEERDEDDHQSRVIEELNADFARLEAASKN